VHALENGLLSEVGIDIDPDFRHKKSFFKKKT